MTQEVFITVKEKNLLLKLFLLQDSRPCSRKKCKTPIDLIKMDSHIRIFAFGKDYAFCHWVCLINWWKEEGG